MTYFICFIIAFNSQYSGLSKEVHNFFMGQLALKWGDIKNGPTYMEDPVNLTRTSVEATALPSAPQQDGSV